MRKFIKMTVPYTEIHCQEITIANGSVVGQILQPFTVKGNYDMARAGKIASKHYKDKNVVVTAVETQEKHYRLLSETFLEMAEEYTPETKEKEEEDN